MKFNYLMIAAVLFMTALTGCEIEDILDQVTVEYPYTQELEFDIQKDATFYEADPRSWLSFDVWVISASEAWNPASSSELQDQLDGKEVTDIVASFALEVNKAHTSSPTFLFETTADGHELYSAQAYDANPAVAGQDELVYLELPIGSEAKEAIIKAINSGTTVDMGTYMSIYSVGPNPGDFSGTVYFRYDLELKSK